MSLRSNCHSSKLSHLSPVSCLVSLQFQRVHTAYEHMEMNSDQNPEAHLIALRAALVEAESSVRGFVITGQEAVLDDFKRHLPKINGVYSALQAKISQRSRVEQTKALKSLLDKRVNYLQTTVDIRRASVNMDLQRHIQLVQMGRTSMKAFERAADRMLEDFYADRLWLRGRVENAFRILWITSITATCGIVILSILGCAGAYGFSVHALKKRNAVLRRLLKDAQDATALKSAFLANISHEIRTSVTPDSSEHAQRVDSFMWSCSHTFLACMVWLSFLCGCRSPMNGILAMSHLLSHTPLTDEQRECNDTVLDSANSMMRLLNDLLLCSKIGAGRFMLNPAPFRVDRLLKHVHDVITSRLAVKQHAQPDQPTVVWKVWRDPKLPNTIIADQDRLQQVSR